MLVGTVKTADQCFGFFVALRLNKTPRNKIQSENG